MHQEIACFGVPRFASNGYCVRSAVNAFCHCTDKRANECDAMRLHCPFGISNPSNSLTQWCQRDQNLSINHHAPPHSHSIMVSLCNHRSKSKVGAAFAHEMIVAFRKDYPFLLQRSIHVPLDDRVVLKISWTLMHHGRKRTPAVDLTLAARISTQLFTSHRCLQHGRGLLRLRITKKNRIARGHRYLSPQCSQQRVDCDYFQSGTSEISTAHDCRY